MCENLGRWLRSFCQQSSMSWCRGGWQFAGAGRRKPSSTAFITCRAGQKGEGTALRRQNYRLHPNLAAGRPSLLTAHRQPQQYHRRARSRGLTSWWDMSQ